MRGEVSNTPMSRHEAAGYPAPWHSNSCNCPICTDLRARDEAEGVLEMIRDMRAGGVGLNPDALARTVERLAEVVVSTIPDRRLRGGL